MDKLALPQFSITAPTAYDSTVTTETPFVGSITRKEDEDRRVREQIAKDKTEAMAALSQARDRMRYQIAQMKDATKRAELARRFEQWDAQTRWIEERLGSGLYDAQTASLLANAARQHILNAKDQIEVEYMREHGTKMPSTPGGDKVVETVSQFPNVLTGKMEERRSTRTTKAGAGGSSIVKTSGAKPPRPGKIEGEIATSPAGAKWKWVNNDWVRL
jgi:hypothetical protein